MLSDMGSGYNHKMGHCWWRRKIKLGSRNENGRVKFQNNRIHRNLDVVMEGRILRIVRNTGDA